MPIRINFLAEEQAALEMRRRDPVKRAILGCVAILVLMLVLIGANQLRRMKAASELKVKEEELAKIDKDARSVEEAIRRIADIEQKTQKLKNLAANRFLWSRVLETLQKCNVDGVQVTRMTSGQQYDIVQPVAPKGENKGKPGSSTERIRIVIDGRDSSPSTGQSGYSKFRDALAATDLFKSTKLGAGNVRLLGLSQPVGDPTDPTRTTVTFTIECIIPETIR